MKKEFILQHEKRKKSAVKKKELKKRRDVTFYTPKYIDLFSQASLHTE